jgi:hypothetical protein
MDDKRTYLKDLATQQADAWAASASPSTFAGEMRVETRNTVYTFKDGACVSVTRKGNAFKSDPTAIVGMRMIGWLFHDDPYAGLQHAWRPGAYAVLWRSRGPGEASSAVALTSTTTTMLAVRRTTPPPLPRSSSRPPPLPVRAVSLPPPLPARVVRASTTPPPPPAQTYGAVKISTPPMPTFGAIGRPPTPSHVRPRPASMTRMNEMPPPAALPATTPTSTVTRRPSVPPPLPMRARTATATGTG